MTIYEIISLLFFGIGVLSLSISKVVRWSKNIREEARLAAVQDYSRQIITRLDFVPEQHRRILELTAIGMSRGEGFNARFISDELRRVNHE